MATVTINDHIVTISDGETILDAAKKCSVRIPNLCYFEGKHPIGACRVCLVEVQGRPEPVASCCTPATDGMKVLTNSNMAREARRTVVELLLSEHNGDCTQCVRNEDCELQQLAREMGIKEIHHTGEKCISHKDFSTPGLVRDSGKCINCRRCIEVCSSVQTVAALAPQNRGFKTSIGPSFQYDLDTTSCVQCGQCAAVCPVGAIVEKDQIENVWNALNDPTKHVIVQTAPAIRAALGEEFGYPAGTLVTGKMVTALKKLGFKGVFDTNFTADLTIIEEGYELLDRLKRRLVKNDMSAALPQYTSCSPGWILYSELFHPEILPNLSTCKSPQQMFGALAKTYYPSKVNIDPKNIVSVSIMPCTAKKYEAERPEMCASGHRDVDYVLTTREFARMIKQAGIDFNSLEDGVMDAPLGLSSGAADIFGNTGGVMEAAIRTVYEVVTGDKMPTLRIEPLVGLKGIKEAAVTIEKTVPEWSFLKGATLKVAVAHGLSNAKELIEKIQRGEAEYHFIEVMTCPGGCIGGGGQPRFTTQNTREKRIKALYREDENKSLRKSHDNPAIVAIYKEFLGEPLGEKSHELLHTKYFSRNPHKAAQAGIPTKTVLMIDNDPDTLKIYGPMLRKAGFNVEVAINNRSGFEKAKTMHPDLIILDAMMESTTDGIELLKAMRDDPRLIHTPIIMMTSINSTFNFEQVIGKNGEKLPINGFIEKPADCKTLTNVVRNAIELHEEKQGHSHHH